MPTQQEWELPVVFSSKFCFLVFCWCRDVVSTDWMSLALLVSSLRVAFFQCAHFLPVEFSDSLTVFEFFHSNSICYCGWWPCICFEPHGPRSHASWPQISKALLCFWRRHCDSWWHHTGDIPWVPLLWAAEMQVATFRCCQAALCAKEKSFFFRKKNSIKTNFIVLFE